MSTEFLVLLLDLGGTVAFAVYGALSAIRYTRLDLLGVLVVGSVTATGGGAMRDALLGSTPVNAISDWRYPAAALVGAFITYLAVRWLSRFEHLIVVFDAVGLGFFAVSGASKALALGASPIGAVLLGMLTAVGGGTLRDILIRRVPSIMYEDLYATSALVGALVVVVASFFGIGGILPSIVGFAAAVLLRLVAWRFKISAPGVPGRKGVHPDDGDPNA